MTAPEGPKNASLWQADLVTAGQQEGSTVQWHVPEEAPVALIYNGLTFAVMLASPTDLHDFITGFSLTEGIVDGLADISKVELHERRQGIDIHVTISAKCFERLSLRQSRRSMEGRTSCGLCGIDSAERLFESLEPVAAHPKALDASVVTRAAEALEKMQPLRALNKSVHGAAFVNGDGVVMLVREDVGRHNALDKLIGAIVREGLGASDGFVLMTSRASFEIVEKAARSGVTALVALSAPTGFAIRRAGEANMTLANFSRGVLTVF
ncbi:formate dehydrogenase accessory sulfurtransferase FdhD [Kordiimonas gwangyangensis]|uniref:formate dehydrogenase accessory sulfurtransferase FdhD n=1 Tax=Kordiimonas gwangyangensis TaxID=288022 RepID=UPI00037F7662|nr:formate dehydrogenase accessory sulfurtransferase FdhD [Kordiimonas gwangyangensis]